MCYLRIISFFGKIANAASSILFPMVQYSLSQIRWFSDYIIFFVPMTLTQLPSNYIVATSIAHHIFLLEYLCNAYITEYIMSELFRSPCPSLKAHQEVPQGILGNGQNCCNLQVPSPLVQEGVPYFSLPNHPSQNPETICFS